MKIEKKRKNHDATGNISKNTDPDDDEVDEALEILKGGFNRDLDSASDFSASEDSD